MNIGLKVVFIYMYILAYMVKNQYKKGNYYIRSYLYRDFIIKRYYFLEVWLYMKNKYV